MFFINKIGARVSAGILISIFWMSQIEVLTPVRPKTHFLLLIEISASKDSSSNQLSG